MASPYVVVAVPVPARKEFTYALPAPLAESDLIGRRVVVPFGARKLTGVVVDITSQAPPVRARKVLEVLDEAPIIDAGMLKLTRWVAEYYLASWGEALKTAMPAGWNRRSRRYVCPVAVGEPAQGTGLDAEIDAMVSREGRLPVGTLIKRYGNGPRVEGAIRKLVRAGRVEVKAILEDSPGKGRREAYIEILPEGCVDGAEKELRKNAIRQIECLLYLRAHRRARRSEMNSRFGTAPAALEKRGFVRTVHEQRRRIADDALPEELPLDCPLTGEQKKALAPVVSAIEGNRFEAHLLFGITGSGKTEVYLRAASAARSLGRSVLILVPEISLTPQTIVRFRAHFGEKVAVLHSALTPSQRHDTWREIHRGAFPVVVGVRSTIFAPMKNLGLIVVDEEHDGSYKQGESPRYHARDVAVVRARFEGIPIILGSATPSLESYANSLSGKYRISRLDTRIEGRPLPAVEIVNIGEVPYEKRIGVLTPALVDKIGKTLAVGDQAMVFLNRRGFSPFLNCADCGYVPGCSHCEVSYTWHKHELILRCHYCGTEEIPPTACPTCGGGRIKHRGIGTQRVEEDLYRAFPGARIARMDLDSTRRRDSIREILSLFSNGEIDILLGTQMIAKGHHFPGVSLVGIVNADTALHLPDFRAGERSFQLLVQVSGRAGRGERKGEVVVQSFAPDHYCVASAANHNYVSFMEREMEDRRALLYPPFSRIVAMVFRGKVEGGVQRSAERFRDLVKADRPMSGLIHEVLGPTPAPIPRIRDRYRWRILIKGRTAKWSSMKKRLALLIDHHRTTPAGKQVEILVDVDALDLL